MTNSKSKNKEGLKFLEAIVYMILIIVTIIANTYGSIYLKIIPLLLLLGMVGRIFYSRPIVTSIFGGVFSIVTMYINGTYTVNEILICSLTNTVLILCGEIFAICLVTCIKDIKKKKSKSTKVKNVIISVLFFILSIYITLYLNGNIFRYEKSKEKLVSYLKEKYSDLNFEVDGYRYVAFKDRGYSFKVKNQRTNSIYKFVVYEREDIKIYDGFEINIVKVKNNTINEFLYENIKEENIEVKGSYDSYDRATVFMTYRTDSTDYVESLVNKLVEVNGSLLSYYDYKDIYELKVTVERLNGDKVTAVYFKLSDYLKQLQEQNEYEYLTKMFEIEFFDF